MKHPSILKKIPSLRKLQKHYATATSASSASSATSSPNVGTLIDAKKLKPLLSKKPETFKPSAAPSPPSQQQTFVSGAPASAATAEPLKIKEEAKALVTEIAASTHSLKDVEFQQDLKKIFEEYDVNKDGEIDVAELREMINAASDGVTEEEVQRMMSIADLDGDGKISFEEFYLLCDKLHILEYLMNSSGASATTSTGAVAPSCTVNRDSVSILSALSTALTSYIQIDDPQLIFQSTIRKLLEKYNTTELSFPREVMLLGGAPGAGKGSCTAFIMRIRGYTAPPIVMSDLLNSPHAKKIKESGGLVSDSEVVFLLFDKLLQPEYSHGALVDGFPRSKSQVQNIKYLYDYMASLHNKYQHDPILSSRFPRPCFRTTMLYVEEKESIERQLQRGKKALAHNKTVLETQQGELVEVRETDLSVEAARKRYKLFKDQFESLNALKQIFPYHFISAQGPVVETQHNIEKELLYQSSLELDADTYESISTLPTASDVIQNSRQELVTRLDYYQHFQKDLFRQIIQVVKDEFYSIIKIHSMSGECMIRSRNPIFHKTHALEMVVDILSDRGFSVTVELDTKQVPYKIEKNVVVQQKISIFKFFIRFERPKLYSKV